jgi:hypothetical protein
MANLIEKAREKLRELELEAEQLRTFIRVYAHLTGDKSVDNESVAPHIDAESNSETGKSGTTATPTEIVETARELMKERGRPLTRSELLKALREKGLNLPGKDATKNIGTVIWRSKKFDNIAGEGYWPKDFNRWMGQRQSEPNLPLAE